MPPETLARIFEPFFTTKEQGKGTGLGLSSASGIVQQTGGAISVESSLNRGTLFRVYLPTCAESEAEEAASSAGRASVAASRSGTVLVVEDEVAVRDLVCSILEKAGYRVLRAADGKEAQKLASRATVPIDLVLSDVVMPGISGPALVTKLRSQRPDLKVLLMSGYDRNLIEQLRDSAAVHFLPKPFGQAELLLTVEKILAGSQRASRVDESDRRRGQELA
jgi:two-component system cell cycle sensor histidine kinase/response regulator CckA